MRCQNCQRTLFVADLRDDKQQGFRGVACECGAFHRLFVSNVNWFMGLEGCKDPVMEYCPSWSDTWAGPVRWAILVNSAAMKQGKKERMFVMRVPLDDPRPWGEECFDGEFAEAVLAMEDSDFCEMELGVDE